jgi:hypothetical protein
MGHHAPPWVSPDALQVAVASSSAAWTPLSLAAALLRLCGSLGGSFHAHSTLCTSTSVLSREIDVFCHGMCA